jgi:hypothetical protein
MKPRVLPILVLAGLAIARLHADDAPPLASLLQRAAAYVALFQTEFASFVSDEDYTQRVRGQLYPSERARQTRSEMVFTWLPDQRFWLTVRNVLSVDGHAVTDSQDSLRQVMADPASHLPSLQALRERGASFNLGHIHRTTNDPNLVLLFLDPGNQNRFTFSLRGRETINGTGAWKISYEEQTRPTVIQDGASGADLFSHGTLWVSDSGVVVRTEVSVFLPKPDTYATVDVEYKPDARLSIWLPWRMKEQYAQWLVMRGAYVMGERVECTATYSNFRRFETSARILAN